MTNTAVHQHSSHHDETRSRLHLAAGFRVVYVLWMFSFMKDWFTSQATHYPERIFAEQAGSILFVGAVLLWPASRILKLRLLWLLVVICAGCTLSPALLVAAAAISTALAVGSELCRRVRIAALICATASIGLLATVSRTGLAAAGITVVFTSYCSAPELSRSLRRDVLVPLGIGLLALFAAVTFMPGSNSSVTMLGLGFGQSNSHRLGTLLLDEQGVFGLLSTAAITYVALLSSLIALTDGGVSRERRTSAALACGGFTGVMLLAHSSTPFLTTKTTGGTLAFAVLAAAGVMVLDTKSSAELRHSLHRLQILVRNSAVGVVVVAALTGIWLANVSLQAYHQVLQLRGVGVPHNWPNQWVPLSAISQEMQDATISMEDGSFYHNCGIDFYAEHYALRVDLRAGHPVLGGSTITQQLARNLFLDRRKTLVRKLREAVYALVMGRMLTKQRVLELYLNIVNYGMSRRGIFAAARGYFHCLPAQLTIGQSAVLVGIVPQPPRLAAYTTSDGEPPYPPLELLNKGRLVALSRLRAVYPHRYSERAITRAEVLPITSLVYPWKDAVDRGAVDVIPPVWHGVSFYSFAAPSQPMGIDNVSPYLKEQLRKFVLFARKHLGITGIDNLGVYCDRAVRGHPTILSSHAYGDAIDISGFRFADNTQVKVAQHTNTVARKELLTVEQQLKRYFRPVVDWRTDPRWHNTHFHCEVKGPRTNAAQDGVKT